MNIQEKTHPLSHPLKEELDEVAQEQDVSWHRTGGGIYLFRNNRWYRDDKLEVPSALLHRWLQQLEALQMPPTVKSNAEPIAHFKARMDWEAEVVSRLTEWQLATSFSWAAMERTVTPAATSSAPGSIAHSDSTRAQVTKEIGYPFIAAGFIMMKELGMLRFYAGLDETQREALLACQEPMEALSLAQQQQALYLAPTLRYMAGIQPVWLGIKPIPDGGVVMVPGGLNPGYGLHLVVVPVY